MKRSILMVLFLCLLALLGSATDGMAKEKKEKKKKSKVPTMTYVQYNLDPGPTQTQAKSNIEITLQVIRNPDIYKYPGLFAFDPEQIARYWTDPDQAARDLKWLYPKGPDGLSWENPFSSPGGRVSLLLCWAKIVNNTDHILRMKDARVYLIPEGKEPLGAYSSIENLYEAADVFEAAINQSMASRKGLISIRLGPKELPKGFFRTLVLSHKDAYKLLNDLSKEVLPAFSSEGFLIFPSVPDIQGNALVD